MKNIIFNFDEMNSKDKVSKAISKFFSRAGAQIVQIDVPKNIKRTSGISYREVSLTFADSQTVVFRVKQTGDIYQILINNRMRPIKNQDDHISAIDEIVKVMDSGRSAFQKKLAATKVEIPKGVKSTVPKKREALIAKRDALNEAIQQAEAELNSLKVA